MPAVACGECGLLLADDGVMPPPKDLPCSQCGSLSRRTDVEVGGGVQPTIIDYPSLLLNEAEDLIEQGRHGIAIVVAHMACAIAVQRSLSAAFARKHIGELEEPVSKSLSGYNLDNDRLREFYTALTGDAIAVEPFWTDFTQSAHRCNRIVHEGIAATLPAARESLEAARAFVEHVSRHTGLILPQPLAVE
jgi:hypothetical protein